MKKRTQLSFPAAMKETAVAHGAYFDKDSGAWFVDGELPGPLVAFLVQEARRRDYVADSAPQCRVCGAGMSIKSNRMTGQPFWACGVFKCPGTRDFDSVDLPTTFSKVSMSPVSSAPSAHVKGGSVLFEDRERAAGVIKQAAVVFGNDVQATKWLNIPKVKLKQRTPLQAIQTVAGCILVERLLDELFS